MISHQTTGNVIIFEVVIENEIGSYACQQDNEAKYGKVGFEGHHDTDWIGGGQRLIFNILRVSSNLISSRSFPDSWRNEARSNSSSLPFS